MTHNILLVEPSYKKRKFIVEMTLAFLTSAGILLSTTNDQHFMYPNVLSREVLPSI
jgi:hypothetical protein